MGGIFSKPKAPPPPPPPKPAVEQATFTPGESSASSQLTTAKRGKKRLQIGSTTVTGGTGLNTGM